MLGDGVVLSVEMNGRILCQVGHETILTFYAKSLRQQCAELQCVLPNLEV